MFGTFQTVSKVVAIACGYPHVVQLWNIEATTTTVELEDHTEPVTSVAFSPDDKLLVSGSYDGTLRMWDLESYKSTHLLPSPGVVHHVAWSSDGSTIASAGADGTIRLWRASEARWEVTHTLQGHTGSVNALAFSGDGTHLVSGSDDSTVRLWAVSTGVLVQQLGSHNGPVYSIAFNEDGTLAASGGEDSTVKLWDIQSRGEYAVFPRTFDVPTSLAFCPGRPVLGACLMRDNYSVTLWDTSTKQLLEQVEGIADECYSLAFNSDGSLMACCSGGIDNGLELWQVT